MKRILVPVDFSSVTDALVEEAALLARAFGGEMRLLYVATPNPYFAGHVGSPEEVRAEQEEEALEEKGTLRAYAERLEAAGLRVSAVFDQGPTVRTILQHATEMQADLIVMGSHGRRALLRALMGSTSEGVLHRAQCPVLIVPSRVIEP